MTASDAAWRTEHAGLPPPRRGKVRDIYDLGDRLLYMKRSKLGIV